MTKWMIKTRQDLISHYLWPRTEVTETEELAIMSMHHTIGRWNKNKSPSTRTADTSPRSKAIHNLIIATPDSELSYNITNTSNIFTTPN
jgi:hypothetical protein